jgi:hypothetical protein
VITALALVCSACRHSDTTSAVTATPTKPVFHQGETVTLGVQVHNTATSGCLLSRLPLAAIVIDGVSHDGQPVTPATVDVEFDDGIIDYLDDSLDTVASGAFETVTLTTSPGAPGTTLVQSLDGTDDASANAVQWPVSQPGQYTVRLHYRLPDVAGLRTPTCVLDNPAATATFQVVAAGLPASN